MLLEIRVAGRKRVLAFAPRETDRRRQPVWRLESPLGSLSFHLSTHLVSSSKTEADTQTREAGTNR